MPQAGKHNGKQIALVEFVKANPGRSAGEILAAVGAENRYNVLTLAMKIGAVWPAGPVSYRVYYPTEQEAKDAEPAIIAAHARQVELNRQKRQQRRRERNSAGCRRATTAQPKPVKKQEISNQEPVISPNCKITIAPPFVDRRWEPDIGPGWVGAITADWFERRQVRP